MSKLPQPDFKGKMDREDDLTVNTADEPLLINDQEEAKEETKDTAERLIQL